MSKSSRAIYVLLLVVLAISGAVSVFLPQFIPFPEGIPPLPIMAAANAVLLLVVYGGLGWLGLRISRTFEFADVWPEDAAAARSVVLSSTLVGLGVGLLFILADIAFSQVNGYGALPHPPFPLSLVASITAGIGEEILFRAFLLSVILWLILRFPPAKKHKQVAFWTAALITALLFGLGHLPSLFAILEMQGTSTSISPVFLAQILLMNGLLSLVAAEQFRKNGLVAAISVHFWTDIAWHFAWGNFHIAI